MKLQPKSNDPSKDLVYTPEHLAKEIITYFQPAGRVLDPSMGHGAFYNNFPPSCEPLWCELDLGRDFFSFTEPVDWTITNPPWSLMRQFTAHAMTLSENIVWLVTINHIFTKARLRDIKAARFGLRGILLLDTPKNFPQSGFQLGAIHLQRNYKGLVKIE